jgi:hypothetical protein
MKDDETRGVLFKVAFLFEVVFQTSFAQVALSGIQINGVASAMGFEFADFTRGGFESQQCSRQRFLHALSAGLLSFQNSVGSVGAGMTETDCFVPPGTNRYFARNTFYLMVSG